MLGLIFPLDVGCFTSFQRCCKPTCKHLAFPTTSLTGHFEAPFESVVKEEDPGLGQWAVCHS